MKTKPFDAAKAMRGEKVVCVDSDDTVLSFTLNEELDKDEYPLVVTLVGRHSRDELHYTLDGKMWSDGRESPFDLLMLDETPEQPEQPEPVNPLVEVLEWMKENMWHTDDRHTVITYIDLKAKINELMKRKVAEPTIDTTMQPVSEDNQVPASSNDLCRLRDFVRANQWKLDRMDNDPVISASLVICEIDEILENNDSTPHYD